MAKTEVRSNYVPPSSGYLPSSTPPCEAPGGYHWVHAYPPGEGDWEQQLVGKWLIRVRCRYVAYCWSCVRTATEEGSLGIGAKVATDYGSANDPSGPWKDHVICVYTADYRDRKDVTRVAARLAEVDAIRTQTIYYKPDVLTLAGYYSGNAPGRIAIYSCKPPYKEVIPDQRNLAGLRAVTKTVRGRNNPDS